MFSGVLEGLAPLFDAKKKAEWWEMPGIPVINTKQVVPVKFS